MRNAGGSECNALPPVWRQHDVLACRGEQVVGQADAGDLSGDVRDSYAELHHVRIQFPVDGAS